MSEEISTVQKNLEEVQNEMAIEIAKLPEDMDPEVILIAVSKKQSKKSIIEAYRCGHKHFGENYVHELFDKSNDSEIVRHCPEIKWHFIGHLQTNKASKLIYACPNLYMIHSIDSIRIADAVNHAYGRKPYRETYSIPIMIQVNTSGEESKSGVPIQDVENVFLHIKENCPNLAVEGLMTIGSPNHDFTEGPNPDFVAMVELSNSLSDKYDTDLKLSMGMSKDFQHAIEHGATYIRVGERIFGKRQVIC